MQSSIIHVDGKSVEGMFGGRQLVPRNSRNVCPDDSAFDRFFYRRIDPEYGGDVDMLRYCVIKHADYPEPFTYKNAVYEIRTKRIKDGVPVLAFVIVHECPQYCHEGWKVCRYTGFKQYNEQDIRTGRAALHLFKDNEFEIECVCRR